MEAIAGFSSIWSPSQIDSLLNSYQGQIPRVGLVEKSAPTTTTTTTKTLGHLETVKRKRDVDVDDDETDSNYSGRVRFKSLKQTTREVSDRDMWQLASMFEKIHKWRAVGKRLGLSKRDLNQIEWKHLKRGDGPDECLYQSIRMFVKRSDHPTVESIIKHLDMSVLDYEKKIADVENRVNSGLKLLVSGEKSNKRPSELDLWRLSEFIWAEWKPVARLLGLSEDEINVIEVKYIEEGARECAYQALLIVGQVLRVDTILAALLEIDLRSASRKFLDIISMDPLSLETLVYF